MSLRRQTLKAISFRSVRFVSPKTVFSVSVIVSATIFEIQAIVLQDLTASLILNTILFLALYEELYHRLSHQNNAAVPIYELQQLHKYAEVGRLTSGFVHDLANPLTAVSLHLEDLHSQSPSRRVKQALVGTKTMQRYVKALRHQLSGQTSHERFRIRPILDTIEQMTSYKARQYNVSLRVDCQVDLSLSGSSVRLQQALSNLICNAIDSYANSELDNRAVTVSVTRQEGCVVIRVGDQGSGITRQHLHKIFEPFFTTKLLDQGTGIGLAITKQIIEQEFGGTINIKSQLGRGTIFTLTLPLKREKIRV